MQVNDPEVRKLLEDMREELRRLHDEASTRMDLLEPDESTLYDHCALEDVRDFCVATDEQLKEMLGPQV